LTVVVERLGNNFRANAPHKKATLLSVHNDLRAKVANGLETRGQQPPASDMLELVWDDEV
jgi:hypothetical protein